MKRATRKRVLERARQRRAEQRHRLHPLLLDEMYLMDEATLAQAAAEVDPEFLEELKRIVADETTKITRKFAIETSTAGDAKAPWSMPDAKPLDDVREYWIAHVGVDTIRLLGFGMGSIWFREGDALMGREEAIDRYGRERCGATNLEGDVCERAAGHPLSNEGEFDECHQDGIGDDWGVRWITP